MRPLSFDDYVGQDHLLGADTPLGRMLAREKISSIILWGPPGTGKTTVATNLARVAAELGQRVTYLDCDVEEPNGQIFLQPEVKWRRPVTLPVPRVDPELCDLCGECGEICEFSAIVPIGSKVLVFPQLCHSCGGCRLVCPPHAITEVPREVATLMGGEVDGVEYLQGLLNIGEAMSPPVIRALKAVAPQAGLVIVDAPPGTSCPGPTTQRPRSTTRAGERLPAGSVRVTQSAALS